MKYFTLILFSLFSIGCQANSCLMTEKDINENSIKYSELVDIKITKTGSLLFVAITAPQKINTLNFNGMLVHKKGVDGNQSKFIMPLNTYIENGKVSTWYNVDGELVEGNYITIDYGESCGISLRYDVK
jgi:hypothetical protein